MPRKLRKQYPGAKYHITARGSGGKKIFEKDDDCCRFLQQLQYALDTDEVILYAYVLMHTHYHLLVETPLGNVATFEHRLNTAYSTYYRFKHKWRGHVLQGRYGGKLVKGDAYLLAVTRYIHLNPVKTRRMQRATEKARLNHLQTYRWSSYPGYVAKKDEEEMINYRWRELLGVLSETRRRAAYRRYVERFISRDDDKTVAALQLSPYAIGDEEFVAEIEEEMRQRKTGAARDADVVWPMAARPAIEDVDRAVAKEFGVKQAELGEHARRAGPAKAVAAELACRLSGLTQRAAGERYGGISSAAIGHLRRRLRQLVDEDPDLNARVDQLEKALGAKS